MAHIAAEQIIYVGASYGLYKSTDRGATWTNVDIPLNNPLLSGRHRVFLEHGSHDASKIYLIDMQQCICILRSPDAAGLGPYAVYRLSRPSAVDFAASHLSDATAAPAMPFFTRARYRATWTRLKIPNTPTTPASRFPLGSEVTTFVPDPTVSGTLYALSSARIL